MRKIALEHYTGCLLGGAVGDALGAPVEFMTFTEIEKKYGQTGVTTYKEFGNEKGAFTDDTQMTLFTAEAMLRAYQRMVLRGIGGAEITIGHMSYLRWLYTQGAYPEHQLYNKNLVLSGWLYNQEVLQERRSPGNTCISSLLSGMPGTIENPINDSKGCGTVMRVAPVGLMFFGENEYAFKTACGLAAITHGHPTGILSAGFLASLIADLAVGIDLMSAVRNAVAILKTHDQHEETLHAVQHALEMYEKTKQDQRVIRASNLEVIGGAWVAEEALAVALYCALCFENDFENGVICAVNHSGDSDSTGAITGNILGLINGIHKIPEHLMNGLKGADLVKEIAEDLYERFKGNTRHPDDEWFDKYPGY